VYYTLTQRAEETAVALAFGPRPPQTFAFRRVSDGMAENAVLAICAARWLGVTPELIRQRLDGWQAAALRADIRQVEGRLLYLDCYNANPASMADALATFAALAPAAEPRLYLLGSMEELGAAAAEHHRELGRGLQLRAPDRVLLIGSHARAVAAGLQERGHVAPQVEVLAELAPAAAVLAEWRGTVFVKGSRRYALEQVLAGHAGVEVAHA
jgi:UDP-N-acetylmuramoyl-tripeptide--D-alanyl-D-alanine ligase